MEELIKITEYNGKKAVSARELYENLEYKDNNFTKFSRRFILQNKFAIEGVDYQRLVQLVDTPNGGKRTMIDFALSIDFAKKICMLSRTEMGEKIRNYFIEVEKRANGTINSELELIIRSANVLREQELRLSKVEEKVDRLIGVHEEAERDLHELPISDEEIPEMSLRDQIRMLVNKYCKVSSLGQHQVWDKVYTTLYYSYHIPLRSYKIRKGESLLDVAERVGCLEKIHVIVSGLFKRLDFIEF